MNEFTRKSLFFPHLDSKTQNFIWIISIAVIYFVAARLSLLIIIEPEGIASIWPPAGIFLSAILITRRNLRPYLIGTLFITDLIAEMIAGTSIPISLIYAFSLTSDAAFSAFLLNRFLGERILFNKVKHVFGFIILSVLISNSIFSFLAASAPKIFLGVSFWHSWISWFASDGIGNLIITPVILSLVYLSKSDWVNWSVKKIIEGTALIIITFIIFPFILSLEISTPYSFIIIYYLIFTLLFWAILRFGIIGTSIEILILTFIILYNIINKNIVIDNISALELVMLVQLSLGLIVISAFILSAFLSELKDAENTARISEQKFRLFFENSMDAILVSSPMGEIESANKAACNMFEMTEKEICSIGREGLIDLNDPRVKILLKERSEKGSAFGEINMLKKDGSVFPAEISSALFKDHEGNSRSSIIIRDISDRKQAEKEILQSEHIFRLFVENSPASIAMFDKEMKYIIASKQYIKDYNLVEQNVVGRSHYEIFPEIPDRWKNIHKRCMEGATERSEADPFPRADGTLDWVRWEIIPWYDREGNIGGIILMSEVITEQKRSLDLLRESENYNRTLFDNSIIGLAVTEMDGKLIDINKAYADIIGRTIEETKQLTYWDITPEKYFDLEQEQLSLLEKTGKYGPYEKEYIHKDGRLIPVRLQGLILERNGKKFTWSSVENISQRVRDEKVLRENEQRLHSIYDTVDDVIVYYEVEAIDKYRFVSVNAKFYKTTGLTPDKVIGKLMEEVFPIESISFALDKHREAIINKCAVHWEEIRNFPTGKVIGEVSAAPVFDHDGRCTNLVVSTHDVTERKLAEEEMKKSEVKIKLSEERYRTLFEYAPDGILIADSKSYYLDANSAMCKMLGYTRDEIIGMHGKDIVVPEEVKNIDPALDHITSGEEYSREWKFKRKDGSFFTGEVIVTTLPDNNLLAMVRDITEQKIVDEKLEEINARLRKLFANLDNIREEERKTVARELHDELGQVITSIKMNLSLLYNSIKKEKIDKNQIMTEINEMQNIIDISKENIKDLIRFLRPEFLDNLGIIVALNHIIDQTIKTSGLEIEFNHNIENITLKPEVENTIFRVIQEAINNAVKHSKAKRIKISLMQKNNIIDVTISDDGIGIKTADLKKKNSVGIIGMQERLKIIGSSLELNMKKGTTLKFSLII